MTICATGVATFLISCHVVILTCVFPFFYILVKSTWALVTGLSMVVYEEGRKLSDRPLFHCLFQLKLPQRGVYRSSGKPSSVAFTELVEGSCSISPRWRVRWTAGRSALVFCNSLFCNVHRHIPEPFSDLLLEYRVTVLFPHEGKLSSSLTSSD